jgi:DNA invertase Pin-like site-specific DNA recombinase
MLIGYARVSTQDQNLGLQEDALKRAGCEKIFTDKCSGSKDRREGLVKAMEFLREGDTLVVWKLDRLGRSLSHLVKSINDLKNDGIAFKSLQENIDTTSGVGKLVFHIFASLAEFERDIIRERTVAGLASAKARGKLGGRPKSLDEKKIALAKAMYNDKRVSVNDICATLGIGKTTFYRYINDRGKNKG